MNSGKVYYEDINALSSEQKILLRELYYILAETEYKKGYGSEGNYSPTQIAVWNKIDDFVNEFGLPTIVHSDNSSTSSNDLVKKAETFANGSYSINGTVRIWGIFPTLNVTDITKYGQRLIYVTKTGTPPSIPSTNPPTNPPTVTHKNPSLTIKKQDKDGNPLGNVQFALTKVKGSDSDWKYTAWTDSNGICKFTNIAPGNYYLYETYNGNEGYDLSKQDGYDSSNGRVYIGQTGALGQDTTYTWTSPVVNKKYGKITVNKIDSTTGKPITSGVEIALCKKDSDGNYQFQKMGEIENGTVTFDKLDSGIYGIFEYSNTNLGYDVDLQGTITKFYGKDSSGNNSSWDKPLLGTVNINTRSSATSDFNKTFEAKNTKYGEITIKKVGEDGHNNLSGAKFALYKGNTKILESNVTDSSTGEAKITKIPYGTYTLKEIEFPAGYDPRIQMGYDSNTGYVTICTVRVCESPSGGETNQITISGNRVTTTDPKDKIEQSGKINVDTTHPTAKIMLTITNRKYINISGYVWEDVPNTKSKNIYNSLYDGTQNGTKNDNLGIDATSLKEKIITSQVDISLIDIETGQKVPYAYCEVDKNGYYYTIKNVTAAYLYKYYVVFDYSTYNEATGKKENQYITVQPFFDKKNGSKALVNGKDITIKDSELVEKANTGTFLDKALTDSATRSLLYNATTYTLNNINLGIKMLPKTDYTISQNLAYALVTMNGYTYKYTYGQNDVNIDANVPTVNWQGKTDRYAYTRDIYPSDIVYSKKVDPNALKVQVIYRIDITNNTTYNISDLYVESDLNVSVLSDKYDSGKQNNDSIDEEGRYALNDMNWHINGFGGSANVNNDQLSTMQSIKSNSSTYIYITFDVKRNALIDLLSGKWNIEDFPTEASSIAYHNYTRKDYFWNWHEQGGKQVATSGYDERKHQTNSQNKTEQAPYLKLILGDERTISGTVFEDTNAKNDSTHEVVGDGKYGKTKENADENKVENVKVELLLKSSKDVSKIYRADSDGNTILENGDFPEAIAYTDSSGKYSLVGVVPGEYYVRFTYGDGNQTLYDPSGNIVKTNDQDDKEVNATISSEVYKSTIVTDINAKNAYSNITYNGNALSDTNYLWYVGGYEGNRKDENGNMITYNLAVDDEINQMKEDDSGNKTNEYEMKEIRYATINQDKKAVTASTPQISVPIELTANKEGVASKSYPEFDRMSFGIIKKPEVRIDIKKEISNVKLTLQNGQILINGNPSSQNLPYVANLDTTWSSTGSGYVKVEMDNPYIYGSTLELQYLLTITNNSDVTYIGDNYYKYGDNSGCEIARVNITELMEYLDPKLKFESKDNIDKIEEKQNSDGLDEEHKTALKTLADKYDPDLLSAYKLIYKLEDDDTHTNDPHFLYTTNDPKEENKKNSSTTVKVTASKILSMQDDDLEFISYTQVLGLHIVNDTYRDPTSLPVAKTSGGSGTTDPSGGTSSSTIAYKGIPTASAKITVTPSTGADKNMTYYIAGLILLISLGAVIVCIKKIRK